MRVKSMILMALLAMSVGGVYAQQPLCATQEVVEKAIEIDPETVQRMQLIQDKIDEYRSQPAMERSTAAVMIPVVVHVVYSSSSQNISDEQIKSAIQALNEDFNGWNTDYTSVRSDFTAVQDAPGFQFCLAQRDPNDNPTDGITRTSTSITEWRFLGEPTTSPNYAENVKFLVKGGKNTWGSDDYLNIWVCNLQGGVLGYATPPGTFSASTQGIVVNYRRFGTTGTIVGGNLNRTTTHEIGHFFNLPHPWESFTASCSTHGSAACCATTVDDGFDDTPPTNGPTYGCPVGDPVKCSGKKVMYENFMDYADDDCSFTFTIEQSAAMVACLNSTRSSLRLSPKGCSYTGVETILETKTDMVNLYPNPASGSINLYVPWVKNNTPVQVINSLGVLIAELEMNETNLVIELEDQAPGMYFINLITEEGLVSKSVILQ